MVSVTLEGNVLTSAGLEDIEAAVRSLDGVVRTLLTIELPSGHRFTVGGGPNVFVTEVAEDDRRRWAVVDPSAGEYSVDLVVGGQRVDYPAKLCVPLGSVLAAVRAFVVEDGARSDQVIWSVET